MKLSRRRLLGNGLASVALPSLGLLPRLARADGTGALPKRLVVVHHPQGTVLQQKVPTGTEALFDLPYILEPLAPFVDRSVFFTGLDNRVRALNTVGNAHFQANLTHWTGMPFARQDPANLQAGGPSIEQVVADRISADTAFRRLDLCAGGSSSNGIYAPHEASFFWYGAEDPVAYYNDPFVALLRIFGDQTLSPADAWAQRARRSAVLDGVMTAFGDLRGRVSGEDQQRLDAHLDKLSALESRIVTGGGACTSPTILTPNGYRNNYDDDVSTPLMNDLLVAALSCDLTRVATFHFANSHDHAFPWLWARNGGPIVNTARHENWHAMVHEDYQAGMEHVYRWYHEMLADLLTKMDNAIDGDGDNLLETSLVVCASEYASGRHLTNMLSPVWIGNTGPFARGRLIDNMIIPIDQVQDGYYPGGDVTFSQHLVSILNAFGFDDSTFGYVGDEIPEGGVPGL